MSKDLDAKLREIILLPYKYPKGDGATMFDDRGDIPIIDRQIAQIKAAFSEAGYVQPYPTDVEMVQAKGKLASAGYMTGQEWYASFVNELTEGDSIPENMYYENVLSAARRAANLDTKEEK